MITAKLLDVLEQQALAADTNSPDVTLQLIAVARAALELKRAVDTADSISLANDRAQAPDREAERRAERAERAAVRAVIAVLRQSDHT